MRPRPSLREAISYLNTLASQNSEDAIEVLAEYVCLKQTNEFLAARFVVEIVVSIKEELRVNKIQHGYL